MNRRERQTAILRLVAERALSTQAELVQALRDEGHDVAFLCQGDPFFYGSFGAIFTRLAPRYPVTIVPGVSSLVACAAAAAPLVQRDETVTVIPATLPEPDLARRLADCDSAAIIKLGRHAGKVRGVLATLGLLDDAIYVERATNKPAPLVNKLRAALGTILIS